MSKQDPLWNAPGQELFDQVSKVCSGFSADTVAMVGLNLLVNAVRQNRAWRSDAKALYDEFVDKGRHVLLQQHYDGTGRRRNIFPFHQVIEATPVVNLNKIKAT